jgi:leucyl aminopeptidase
MIVRVLDKKAPDAVVIPLAQTDQLAALLTDIANRTGTDAQVLQQDFTAEFKESMLVYTSGMPTRRVFLLGLGKKTVIADYQQAFRSFCFKNKSKLPGKLAIDLRHFDALQIPVMAEAAITGALLAVSDIGSYKSEKTTITAHDFGGAKSEIGLFVSSEQTDMAENAARRGEAMARAIGEVFRLLNAPGNVKTPLYLAEQARVLADTFGFRAEILDLHQIREQGLQALEAVGKGSPHPPALIVLEYGAKSRKEPLPVIGLVGKGITFDTGGVSLKPSNNMHLMKSDMGGAAAVLGAFVVAAALQLPVRLVGAIPTAENMIDGNAIKPGDVIGSYAGKTIEVTDTDAEGRLVLADALAWLIKKQKPEVLLDLATLTGSIIRALGYNAAGMFTKNDELAAVLSQAGDAAGERLWRMPMWDEYGADLKSDVADLRNFTGKPMAESISAAKFLEHFTSEHPLWAHLDVAGTVFADSEYSQSRIATGYGVRLLLHFIEQWTALKSNRSA